MVLLMFHIISFQDYTYENWELHERIQVVIFVSIPVTCQNNVNNPSRFTDIYRYSIVHNINLISRISFI